MQNSMWTKGLVLGIIILFLGAGVLPSVCGNEIKISNSSLIAIVFMVGTINNKKEIQQNAYTFNFTGFYAVYASGQLVYRTIKNASAELWYKSKIGIFSEHIVCAIFVVEYENLSMLSLRWICF